MAKYQPKTPFGKRQGADIMTLPVGGGGSLGRGMPGSGTGTTRMIGRTTQAQARQRQSGANLAKNMRAKFRGGR